jgi:DNA-binding NtrC family response regulator
VASDAPNKQGSAAGEQKRRILILDDEPIVGKQLKPTLEKSGFEVEAFEDSAAAIGRLNQRAFDIVVTDLRMEEVDGIQVLEHVMRHCAETKVILITGYATVEVAREAMVKGAFDFIAKPFKPGDLRAVVARAVEALEHQGAA